MVASLIGYLAVATLGVLGLLRITKDEYSASRFDKAALFAIVYGITILGWWGQA